MQGLHQKQKSVKKAFSGSKRPEFPEKQALSTPILPFLKLEAQHGEVIDPGLGKIIWRSFIAITI